MVADPAPPGRQVVEDTLAALRCWRTGKAPEAPASGALSVMGFAEAHYVSWPVAAALGRRLPPAASAMLLAPAIEEGGRLATEAWISLDLASRTLRQAGVEMVSTKGAAWMALEAGPTPWRRMVDVDLLVSPPDIRRAVESLKAAGWQDVGRPWRAKTDYGHPPLLPPGEAGLPLEIHQRLSRERAGVLAGLVERSRPSALPGVRVPNPDDALASMVHHAQVKDRGLPRRTLRLRDMLGWRVLIEDHAADPGAVERRFTAAGQGAAFRAFAALMARVWQDPAPRKWAEGNEAWVDETLAGLADPERLRPWRRRDAWREVWDVVSSRDALREVLPFVLHASRRERLWRHAGRLVGRGI